VAGIPQVDVDFSDPALVEDPFPFYEQVRAAGRVVWNGTVGAWMIAGHDDCNEVLTETSGQRFVTVGSRHPEVTFWFEAPNMIIADGKEHRRLRSGLAKYFTPAAIARNWERRVREVVDELLTPLVEGQASFDLIADFTKIPVVIVAEMLGVPEERHEDFRNWSNIIISNLRFGHENPEERRVMDQAIADVNAYIDVEIERHRREELDDVMTIMVNMPDWSEAEIRSSAINLLLAGYDTTARLMGAALVALEQHPDQRRLLAENPELIPNGIEEILRWVGSTQAIVRLVARDTELAGTELTEGQILYLLLIAANHDPSRWADPHVFDVRRPYQTNFGFGGGPHICIGAHLARLETQVAVEALLRLAPEYHLRDIDYGDAFFARGPEKGIVDVSVASAA
jgi:cytochrome P450